MGNAYKRRDKLDTIKKDLLGFGKDKDKFIDPPRKGLIKYYNITFKIYEAMLEKQNNMCAICGKIPLVDTKKFLHVDHDHITGKVRGLLCVNCNLMLGLAMDLPIILQNAINYLKEHGKT